MFEKAKQLRPLAGAGLTLLIVLANPLGMLVPLDDWHMQAAMWGNAAIAIAIDTTTGSPAEGHEPYRQLENLWRLRLAGDGRRQGGGLGVPTPAHHGRCRGARTGDCVLGRVGGRLSLLCRGGFVACPSGPPGDVVLTPRAVRTVR
jgi:hypothetical protein